MPKDRRQKNSGRSAAYRKLRYNPEFVRTEKVSELIGGWNQLNLDERMAFIQEIGLWVICSYQRQEDSGRYALAPVARHGMFSRIIDCIGATVGRMYAINRRNEDAQLKIKPADEEKLFQILSPLRIEATLRPVVDTLEEVISICNVVLGYDRDRKDDAKAEERTAETTPETPIETQADEANPSLPQE